MSHGARIRSKELLIVQSIESRLSDYSLAAVVAGVGILALAQPAEGEIIVTDTNVPICGTTIDMNNDGVGDFALSCPASFYDHTFYVWMLVSPLTGGKTVGGARGSAGPYASALSSGAKIGPTAHFSSSVGIQQLTVERSNGFVSGPTFTGYSLKGPWGNKGSRYLGVKFLIKGATHYGWIRMEVTRTSGVGPLLNGTIYEYAYETIANKEIGAGATTDDPSEYEELSKIEIADKPKGPSLGMLALGADGISIWRQ